MIVLDANILIRAVLGARVRRLIQTYGDSVLLVSPHTAIGEMDRHLPGLADRRHLDAAVAAEIRSKVIAAVEIVLSATYAPFEAAARQRLERRDEDDWPILATALALGCPIWTEDLDFFGCGVATWTSDRVELYLKATTEN